MMIDRLTQKSTKRRRSYMLPLQQNAIIWMAWCKWLFVNWDIRCRSSDLSM